MTMVQERAMPVVNLSKRRTIFRLRRLALSLRISRPSP